MIYTMIAAVCGLFGRVIGSFLNVVIHRVPRGESVVSPPSRCPGCETPIRPIDNVPVLSWLALRGRCRSCRQPIAWRYPAIELVTGVLFAAAGLRFGGKPQVAAYCLFFAVLVAIGAIDVDHRIVPRKIVYPALVGTGGLLVGASVLTGSYRPLVDAALGAVVAFLVLFAIHFIQPNGMGFGDVRLAGLIGLNLGWLGLAHVAVGIFAGFLLGAVLGMIIVAVRGGGRRSAIPFAPFLAAGAVVAVLFGNPIVHAWLHR
ncbi:MAG TPA: prepilin peptidase [Acidimicrobiales bacterium]|nr:prepilin peptidase [Acidimicrobiales bacterium]